MVVLLASRGNPDFPCAQSVREEKLVSSIATLALNAICLVVFREGKGHVDVHSLLKMLSSMVISSLYPKICAGKGSL